jgi:very-short-patch-repair endonuclease
MRKPKGPEMLKNIAPKATAESVRKARQLRAQMSLPEVLLWQALRKQSNGIKFRRQHPSGAFDMDFFCSDARLIIEVDGEAHSREDRPQRDRRRDRWFGKAGVETLRIPAQEVLHDLDAVVKHIMAEVLRRLPPNHPALQDDGPRRRKRAADQ